MPLRRIGILGGTFDPIHRGHVDLGDAAASALELTQILVVTSNIPGHRAQPVASIYHRFAMVALVVAGRPKWQASDLDLHTEPPTFTTDTLRRFHARGYAPSELFFIIGADAFAEIETWKDYPAILDRTHFAVVSRAGVSVREMATRLPRLAARMAAPAEVSERTEPSIFLIDAVTADVSSTAIRRLVAAGGSAAGLVPPNVQQHIEQHQLYRSVGGAGEANRASAAGMLHGQD